MSAQPSQHCVMAPTCAGLTELRARVAELNVALDDVSKVASTWFHRAETAEARVAELEAAIVCANCETPVDWIHCPTGGWWAHRQHPANGHDAHPMPATAVEK